MSENEDRDWVTVGAEVASVSHCRDHNSVRFAKIDRIGKRDIVLDNGERFRVRDLQRETGDTWSLQTSRLMRRNDPHVLETVATIRRKKVLRAAIDACEEFRYTNSVRGSKVTAADVILALAPLTGIADEIADLFTRSAPTTAAGDDGEGVGA